MTTEKFQRLIEFDLNAVNDINLFEYFHLVRCVIITIILSESLDQTGKVSEIAGVMDLAVRRLDQRYRRANWTMAVSEHADLSFFFSRQGRPALTWKHVICLFPNLNDYHVDRPVLKLLLSGPPTVEAQRALIFDHQTATRTDFPEAFALCRCFLRHELLLRINGGRTELQEILRMLATVLSNLDRHIGREWVDRIHDALIHTKSYSERVDGKCQPAPGYREKVLRLFPPLNELGMIDAALKAWRAINTTRRKRTMAKPSEKLSATVLKFVPRKSGNEV